MSILWPSASNVIALAGPIIRQFEGYRAKAYLCPAGIPTLGYGTTRYPDGRKVTLADPLVTEPQARAYAQASMERVWRSLQASGAVKRSPTAPQGAALLSLAYNVGVGAHDGIKGDLADSTLLEMFNRGDIAGAADQFLAWNKARVGGKLTALAGLTRRRERERELFLTA